MPFQIEANKIEGLGHERLQGGNMDEDRSWCIYVHTCIDNNKKYIGLTCNLEKRWGNNGQKYLRKRENGDWVQPEIANAIVKHGWDSFSHEIIQENLTLEEANILEDKLIKEFDTQNPDKGYNIRDGGSHGHLSPKSIEKMRKTIGTSRQKEKNTFYHKQHTEETKKIIGAKNKEHAKNRDLSGKNNFYFLKYYYICIEEGKVFTSSSKAGEFAGTSKGCIAKACNNENRTAGGYHWKKVPQNQEELDNLKLQLGKIGET